MYWRTSCFFTNRFLFREVINAKSLAAVIETNEIMVIIKLLHFSFFSCNLNCLHTWWHEWTHWTGVWTNHDVWTDRKCRLLINILMLTSFLLTKRGGGNTICQHCNHANQEHILHEQCNYHGNLWLIQSAVLTLNLMY